MFLLRPRGGAAAPRARARTYTLSLSLALTNTHTPSCINGICLYTGSHIFIPHVRALSLTHARTHGSVRFGHDPGADPEMRLRNGTFLTVILFALCGFISLSWYTAFSNSKGKTRVFCSVRARHVPPRSVMHSDAELQLFNTTTRTPSVFTAPQTITGLMLFH